MERTVRVCWAGNKFVRERITGMQWWIREQGVLALPGYAPPECQLTFNGINGIIPHDSGDI
jgi:hypothetical protein